jgi:hypothetical protein
MAEATTPDAIAKWTGSDPVSLVQESQTQAASIQAALDKRERFDYVWADQSARTAQTGMVQGSRGYQVDTRTEYTYDNSAWRRNVMFAEYNHPTQSIPSGVVTAVTGLTINASASTDLTFTSVAAGYIQHRDLGVYTLSWIASSSVSSSNPYIQVSENSDNSDYFAFGGQTGTIAAANTTYFVPTTNYRLYYWIRQGTGSSQNYDGVIRVLRIA